MANCIECGAPLNGRLAQETFSGPMCLACWEATDNDGSVYQQALAFLGLDYDQRVAGEVVEATL